MTRILILAALLALSSQANAYGNGRYGINDNGPKPPPAGKRSLGGTDPCCAEDPGQQPRK